MMFIKYKLHTTRLIVVVINELHLHTTTTGLLLTSIPSNHKNVTASRQRRFSANRYLSPDFCSRYISRKIGRLNCEHSVTTALLETELLKSKTVYPNVTEPLSVDFAIDSQSRWYRAR